MHLSEEDAKLYNKFTVSTSDIWFARYCATVILKKDWHSQPWERRGTIYQQQAAFTSALITAYARPFIHSRGWPKLPPDLIARSCREEALHKRLIKLRHTVFAHSDSISYSIRPVRIGNFTSNISNSPVLRITAEETVLFLAMSNKILESINIRIGILLETYFRPDPGT